MTIEKHEYFKTTDGVVFTKLADAEEHEKCSPLIKDAADILTTHYRQWHKSSVPSYIQPHQIARDLVETDLAARIATLSRKIDNSVLADEAERKVG